MHEEINCRLAMLKKIAGPNAEIAYEIKESLSSISGSKENNESFFYRMQRICKASKQLLETSEMILAQHAEMHPEISGVKMLNRQNPK